MADIHPLFPETSTWGDRTPLSDAEMKAEQGLLGALLLQPGRGIPKIPSTFQPEHYGDDRHRSIHELIVEQGAGANIQAIRLALNASQEDTAYLASLLASSNGWIVVEELAYAVTEAHLRREMTSLIGEIKAGLSQGTKEAPITCLVQQAMTRLDSMLVNTRHYRDGSSLDAALDAAIAATETAAKGTAISGRSTGMISVDEALGGLENGTFNVLGARPGMGKTALALQWALAIARAARADRSGGVVGFSLEMSASALARRIAASHSGISVVDLRRGRIDGKIERLSKTRYELSGLPFWIEDAGGQNLLAIRQKARAAQRRFGHLALIWVDHIQIVRPDEADRRNGATQAVGRISNGLRDISKEFECPVLCLSQLSRGLLSREDKRPNLGDLRQAGDIEQDADNIMFLHREEVLLAKQEPIRGQSETTEKWRSRIGEWDEARMRTAGRAELIFEKVRDGAPCSVNLRFDGPTTSFSEPNNEF